MGKITAEILERLQTHPHINRIIVTRAEREKIYREIDKMRPLRIGYDSITHIEIAGRPVYASSFRHPLYYH